MRIRFTTHAQVRGVGYRPGQTLDVDADTALAYADAQQADIIPTEAAAPTRAGRPDAPPKPKRRRRTKRTDDKRETR